MEANILADGHLKADKLLYAVMAKLDDLGAIKAHACIVNDPTTDQTDAGTTTGAQDGRRCSASTAKRTRVPSSK